MALTQWYLTLALVVAALVVAVWAWRLRGGGKPPQGEIAHAANVGRLEALPRYRTLVREQIRRVLVALLALVLGLAGTGLLIGRLGTVSYTANKERSRDIMLCLDVSGSMSDVDDKILAAYEEIVKDFSGERIGLVTWDSSSVTVFPLTNDYDLVRDLLAEGRQALKKYGGLMMAGTSEGSGSSLIGDGLASCVYRFDQLDKDRPRLIILGTDNYLNGKPIYTFAEAIETARQRKIVVISMGPDNTGKRVDEMRDRSRSTGGDYFPVKRNSSPTEVRALIDTVQKQEMPLPPRRIVRDAPLLGGLLAILGVGLLVVADLRRKR